ncbi:PID-CTERM protein-sorting domain-containing protein [Adhaeribacter terreus]|uniref:PID-CTERM protein-sorting domain-containing protein n=1 Tax=Adhaeribacter terreus TaxID=529703 RepID=A0ABW0EBB4_9BACT
MKNPLKLFKKFTLITGICLFAGMVKVYAQGPPDDGGPTPTEPPPAEIPIDGGASLLVAGGVAYGLKKLRDRRKAR